MEKKSRKIEVFLDPSGNERRPYFYCILEWSDNPTMTRLASGKEVVLKGTENGSWFNTGICGYADSPTNAFKIGLRRFNEIHPSKKK